MFLREPTGAEHTNLYNYTDNAYIYKTVNTMTAPQAQNNCKNLLQRLKNIASLVKPGNPSEDPSITINELGDALLCLALDKDKDDKNKIKRCNNKSCLYNLIKGDGDICKRVENMIKTLTNVSVPIQKCNSIDSSDFSKLLAGLKSIANKIDNKNKNVNKLRSTILDTCYDENKAKKLEKALNKLRKKLKDESSKGAGEAGSGEPEDKDDDFKKLLVLLTASYAMASKDPQGFFYDSEWFYLFVRAAASKKEDKKDKEEGDKKKTYVYIPVCPSLGDAVALYYYYVINFGDAGPDKISKEDVAKIVTKLLPANCTCVTDQQGAEKK